MRPNAYPLVSVCIPTYNRSSRLNRAVECLLLCSYPNLEIIISDNGSTDETERLCTCLCAVHGNIRYFRHPINRGPSENFNFARERATGKYFIWHGDDDHLDADFVSRCVQELEDDPSLVLVSGLGAYHRGDGTIISFGNIIQPHSKYGFFRALKYIFLMEENSIFCGVYRRHEVRQCGMPNCMAGDSIWIAEVLLRGRAKVIPTTYVHRQVGDGTSSSPAKIASVLGAPKWHGTLPWLAVPTNLANHLAFKTFRDKQLPVRLIAYLSVFAVSFFKQCILVAAPRIPYGKNLYRRIFFRG